MLSVYGNGYGGRFGIRVGRWRLDEGACGVCDGGDAPCGGDILPRPVEVAEGRFRGEGRVGSKKFWSEARDGGEVASFDGGEEGGDGGGAE